MKRKKLKYIFIIISIFVIDVVMTSKSIANYTSTTNISNEQNAIQEVATAYYNKGINAQYCPYRKSFLYAPEEATSQHTIYSVCSDFTYSVYYQAFGIKIPDLTHKIIAYGEKYYDINNITTNDVIEYWQKGTDSDGNVIYYDNNGNIKNIDLSTDSGRKQYTNILLTEYNLQIGDVLCYNNGSNGHALLVYDIIYNDNGDAIDALIRESTSQYETKTTKITKGLSYGAIKNENTGVTEGTFREMYLENTYTTSSTSKRNSLVYNMRNMPYFTILRPLLKDENGKYTGQYYDSDFSSDSSTNTGYKCTGRTLKEYEITETSLNRIEYSSIDIEKTVNVFNNAVVSLEDTLEYTIKVTNNSKKTYKSFNVIENISEYVDIVDSAGGNIDKNTICWTISSLQPGKTSEIKYNVKVKNNINVLGKQIISTGTVAGIPSSTVKNNISSNLKEYEKKAICNQLQSIVNSKTYSGNGLISKIYNESLGLKLNLEDFKITDLIIARDGIQYYPEGNSNTPTVYLSEENDFSSWVLSNYYGALYTDSSNTVYIKFWENSSSKISGRSERIDTIYDNHFQTGDILIYQNVQTTNDSVTYETEDGTYYLIYISDEDKITVDGNELCGFIGIDESGNIKNIKNDFTSSQTLLGKDYYVILRPSMAYAPVREKNISNIKVTTNPIKKSYIQNYENLDLTGGIITVTYNDESIDTISLTNEKVKVTGFDNSKIGTNTLTVEYQGITTTFNVEIITRNQEEIQGNDINESINIKKEDNSMSQKILPYTGIKKTIFILVSIISIVIIVLYKKNKEFKDIK